MQVWFRCPMCSVVDDAKMVDAIKVVIDGHMRRAHVTCMQRRSRLAAGLTTGTAASPMPSTPPMKREAAE